MDAKISPLSTSDGPAIQELVRWSFGFTEEAFEPGFPPAVLEWDRVSGAFLDDPHRLAGVHAVHSFDVPVPGGRLPGAGLTWVAVHPRDRRQGVLRAMIDHHLDGVHQRGMEPVSLLFASEPEIYGRFGYGLASTEVRVAVPRGTALREVPAVSSLTVEFERVDADRHAGVLSPCFDAARAERPGWVGRATPGLWRWALQLPPWMARLGAEPLSVLTVSDSGSLRGYALFRRWMADSPVGPAGTVELVELAAVDTAAHRVLWNRLLDLDLTVQVVCHRMAVDDPLLHLLVSLPSATPKVSHNLWCRVVDVPAALAGRRYAAPVDVVLELTDTRCPWNAGRWHLTGDPSNARCEPTSATPQLRLDVRELGALYLGGTPLLALADAGLVAVDDPAALAPASTAFGWPRAPFCPWVF
ncbi:MAG TPA: GNAT family N-acetyltransferase [Actinophytocola sp.]|jgi:predicted acetyltransferase|uniref:GNAT family N-acetyltransferase n=1 Tax=Actinophytocola sp. TaxID=1872138 RepID=UPI002DFBF416|nr:GNAT family N-acetyltransferase [Actinophytocola sp.]